MNKPSFKNVYRKRILVWSMVIVMIGGALYFGIDKKIVLFITIAMGVFTQLFAGLGSLVGMIPWVGPLIIKVVSIPVFWVLNAMGYVVSGVAIKKGYATELAKSRIVTLGLLIGVVLGYILGHLIPLR